MNLYKEIQKAISPKAYHKETGTQYAYARDLLAKGKRDTVERTYNKLKDVMEKYESLSSN